MAVIVYEKGILIDKCKGKLRKYLETVLNRSGRQAELRIYGMNIYIFSKDKALITVLNVPNELRNVARKVIRRHKCGVKNQNQKLKSQTNQQK